MWVVIRPEEPSASNGTEFTVTTKMRHLLRGPSPHVSVRGTVSSLVCVSFVWSTCRTTHFPTTLILTQPRSEGQTRGPATSGPRVIYYIQAFKHPVRLPVKPSLKISVGAFSSGIPLVTNGNTKGPCVLVTAPSICVTVCRNGDTAMSQRPWAGGRHPSWGGKTRPGPNRQP